MPPRHAPFLRPGLKIPKTTGAAAVKDGPWATALRRAASLRAAAPGVRRE
jgi:hypothetical protein